MSVKIESLEYRDHQTKGDVYIMDLKLIFIYTFFPVGLWISFLFVA